MFGCWSLEFECVVGEDNIIVPQIAAHNSLFLHSLLSVFGSWSSVVSVQQLHLTCTVPTYASKERVWRNPLSFIIYHFLRISVSFASFYLFKVPNLLTKRFTFYIFSHSPVFVSPCLVLVRIDKYILAPNSIQQLLSPSILH